MAPLDLFAQWDERAAFAGDEAAAAEVGFDTRATVVAYVLDHLDDGHRQRLDALWRTYADEGDALAVLAADVGAAEAPASDHAG